MAIIYLTDEAIENEILIKSEEWEEQINKLASGDSFYYKDTDLKKIEVNQLASDILPFLLKKTIENMHWLLNGNEKVVDELYAQSLKEAFISNQNQPINENGMIELTYYEGVFVQNYKQEVVDWLPITFNANVIPNRNNIMELISWQV